MYKRLLLIFSLILGSTGIAAFFAWQQVIQLPTWYTNSSPNQNVISAKEQTKNLPQTEDVLRKISNGLTANTTGEVQLDADEINSLIATSLTKKNNNSQYVSAIKGTNTQIKNGKISVSAVIETSSIPTQELSAQKTKVIQLLQNLPGKEKRLYIGIEGKPSIRDRVVSFDDATQVSLGNFSFPIAEVSQNLGLSQDSFNQLLSQELNKLPIKFESINIQGERLIIRGSRNNGK
ncbi:hypothetical protein [Rivularia sp. UHCC 0363]|uniref:hypothetical protein n=1 Tax=Rivularia sp. UHCC 0363 TaxID=3110244 RepID=UPI002B218FE5|nr:hypothetical protein [Rivularia sp. UHCC 0363]MEA5594458.1 hypothetical protein [Rivularia sp. UHCC 0363]